MAYRCDPWIISQSPKKKNMFFVLKCYRKKLMVIKSWIKKEKNADILQDLNIEKTGQQTASILGN